MPSNVFKSEPEDGDDAFRSAQRRHQRHRKAPQLNNDSTDPLGGFVLPSPDGHIRKRFPRDEKPQRGNSTSSRHNENPPRQNERSPNHNETCSQHQGDGSYTSWKIPDNPQPSTQDHAPPGDAKSPPKARSATEKANEPVQRPEAETGVEGLLVGLVDCFQNATNLTLLFFKCLRFIFPTWLFRWIIRGMVVLIILFSASVFAIDSVKIIYCHASLQMAPPWLAASFSHFPPGCPVPKPPPTVFHLPPEDTLGSFAPNTPRIFHFVSHNVANMAKKIALTDMPAAIKNEFTALKETSSRAAENIQRLDDEFIEAQKLLWEAIDDFTTDFTQTPKHWEWSRFWDPEGHDARFRNGELRGILDTAMNSTRESRVHIWSNIQEGVYGELLRSDIYRLQEDIRQYTAIMPNDCALSEDIFSGETVWTQSDTFMSGQINMRLEWLRDDEVWLSEKREVLIRYGRELAAGKGTMKREMWLKKLHEQDKRAWEMALEWRKRLKRYFDETKRRDTF